MFGSLNLVTWDEAAKEQRPPNLGTDFEIGKHRASSSNSSAHSPAHKIHAPCSNVTINLLAMYLALISVH